MSVAGLRSWQAVQGEVRRRIDARVWKPGDMIPNEADLSVEFGCARATVNRALRELAQSGLLERRRKAGTRVAMHPVRKATLDIPVIRHEIEGRQQAYSHMVLTSERMKPPADIRARMRVGPQDELLHLVSVHLADARPHVFEDRWINPRSVAAIEKVDFSKVSANEWLVLNIPFERGDISFSAMTAGAREAGILACREGEGLFVIERTTWRNGESITVVRQTFAPGYRMHTTL